MGSVRDGGGRYGEMEKVGESESQESGVGESTCKDCLL